MNDSLERVMIAFFTALPPTLVALAGLIYALKNRADLAQQTRKVNTDMAEQTKKIDGTAARLVDTTAVIGAKIDNVHEQINSRMDQLLDTTKKIGVAEGVVQGVQQEVDRKKTE